MKKNNILHIINSLDYGGAESLLVDTCNASSYDKFNIHIIYFKGDGYLADKFNNQIAVNKFPISIKSSFNLLNKISRYINRNNIDIIHTHMVQSSLLGRLIAKMKNKICITSRHYINHNSYNRKIYNLEDATIKYSDKIICVSNAVEKYLKSIDISPSKLAVIHNSVPLKENKKIYHEEGLRLGTVCRLVQEKRLDLMILAIKKIKEIYPQVRLEIIGDGNLREHILDLISNYNLEENIILLGQMDRENIKSFLTNWDIYLNSSENESFGISILEAMSYGIPVIASNTGGVPEIIKDNYNGILFDINKDDLSEIIKSLANDKSRRILYATNALDKLKSEFTIKKNVRAIENIYNEFCNEII